MFGLRFRKPWLTVGSFLALLSILGLFTTNVLFAQDGDDNHVFLPLFSNQPTHEHDHIHEHEAEDIDDDVAENAGGGTWPPQPNNINNVNTLPAANRLVASATELFLSGAEAIARADERVQIALGERFEWVGTVSEKAKGQTSNEVARITYFSHTNNATVEVLVTPEGVQRIDAIDPAHYQPPLTAKEVDLAVTLARDFFAEQAVTRVAELEGYTILAFRPEGETGFYANRVGYVSFHVHEDAHPEYIALVDLSNLTVLEGQEG